MTWILTWGKDAEVLSPQSVIDRVKEQIEKMSKLYNINLKN
ncbi:WYL domain-containing protein [Gottfriedia solisilvae]